ncbi:MAG: YdcF family protein [Pseudonocardiaceae bacterium]|nr:YdcF family protein [Pseudonocardiaceae bacterium]
MEPDTATVPDHIRAEVETLWNFHRLDHELRPVDVAVGLGSHDPGVAKYTANLYHDGLFPLIVFTGANAPTTVDRFPRGEAVHFREIAMERGVPDHAILVEPRARHTGENVDFTKRLLTANEIAVQSVLITCRPYQQRRAYATARKQWPEVELLCSAASDSLDSYIAGIADADRVINMLVGDTQRLTLYAEAGHTITQEIPHEVQDAYHRLILAGFTARLIE